MDFQIKFRYIWNCLQKGAIFIETGWNMHPLVLTKLSFIVFSLYSKLSICLKSESKIIIVSTITIILMLNQHTHCSCALEFFQIWYNSKNFWSFLDVHNSNPVFTESFQLRPIKILCFFLLKDDWKSLFF